MRIKTGRVFASFLWDQCGRHVLLALHRRWRLDFVTLQHKPYRRLYLGPLEVEWTR